MEKQTGVKKIKHLYIIYRLNKLIKKGDVVNVPFDKIKHEGNFRSYCCIYSKKYNIEMDINKNNLKEYFKITRTN